MCRRDQHAIWRNPRELACLFLRIVQHGSRQHQTIYHDERDAFLAII